MSTSRSFDYRISRILGLALALGTPVTLSAEEPKPPVQPPPVVQPPIPNPPVAPTIKVQTGNPTPQKPNPLVPAGQINDFTPYLADLQGADAAKADAAEKIFVEAGSRGYFILNSLQKHANPDVVKRVAGIRQKVDARAAELYTEAVNLRQKLQSEPLTPAALEDLRQSWLRMATYAPQQNLKQNGFQYANDILKTKKKVDEANQQLAAHDQALAAKPEPTGLSRASTQLERAEALKTLQRDADALAAAQDAVKSSGKSGRLTPAAIKQEAEMLGRMDKLAEQAAACRRILSDYPRSFETKFAYARLVELLVGEKKWDEAVAMGKQFMAAYPLEEEAQDSMVAILTTLFDDAREYKRVPEIAQWLIATLPTERLRPEIPKLLGGAAEYILNDYATADKAYQLLSETFTDMVEAPDMLAARERLKAKLEGKFPKEPTETDDSPKGAWVKFVKAIREQDAKAITTLVPKDDAEDFADELKEGDSDKVPTLRFADLIVTKVEIDPKDANKATLHIDYYPASASKPQAIKQEAVKEDGVWKIAYEDIEEGADDGATLTIDPAQLQQVK